MTLARKIARCRKAINLTQEDLAEVLDVSRQSVSKWESGKSMPDLDKAIAMAELFHISMDELVRDRPAPPSSTGAQ